MFSYFILFVLYELVICINDFDRCLQKERSETTVHHQLEKTERLTCWVI